MRRKILLLNPPGKLFYMRDYFCSKISKASYYSHPIDFVILSGILSREYDVTVLDCIAERISPEDAAAQASRSHPDIIIFLAGAVSMDEDMPFLKKVKEMTPAFMIGSGDVFLDYAKLLLQKHLFIDAVLLDFATDDILKFLGNREASFDNVVYRDGDEVIERIRRNSNEMFSVPLPRHELFKHEKYVFPFSREKIFATVLTDFGCPFTCTYCPVNQFGYKVRPVQDVIEEIKRLKDLGIREIFFKDQTFTAQKSRTEDLCRQIISEQINPSWTCFSRTETVDEELLSLMKEAGCHTVIFGVETVNQEFSARIKRHIDQTDVSEKVRLCKKYAIETVGTFIIGLPDDTQESIRETILFAKKIPLDYASFNIFTPAHGTMIRRELIGEKLIDNQVVFMDSGVSFPSASFGSLSANDVWKLRKKAILSFYFRPRYLLNRIRQCRNFHDVSRIVKQAYGLIKTL
ncbi:MAG: radical SAM protein [Candidatus Omnitrophica bacterium]|nr:radical SAM protein [Candidatus Omnitrophota bacterium]